MAKKRAIAILVIVAAVVTIALLIWSFRGINKDELIRAFRDARWGYAPLAVIAGLLVFPIKALRWKWILGEETNVPMRPLFSSIMIGFMANCVIPMRIGELVRAAVISIKGTVGVPKAIASIALERIFDFCVVLLFLMLGLLWLRPEANQDATATLVRLRYAGAAASVALVFLISFLVVLRMYPAVATKTVLCTVNWLSGRMRERVHNFLRTFLNELDSIKSLRQFAAISVLSVIHWTMEVLFFLFASYCFKEIRLPFPAAMLVFVFTALSVAAAPVPGYIGIFQGGVLATGAMIGVHLADPSSKSLWVSYAWLSWALNVPPIVLVGFIFLWIEGLSLSQIRLRTAAETEEKAP